MPDQPPPGRGDPPVGRRGFAIAMSLSGVLLDQLETDAPDALASFQELVSTGGVELLGETFHHSLSGLRDPAGVPCRRSSMHGAAHRAGILASDRPCSGIRSCIYDDDHGADGGATRLRSDAGRRRRAGPGLAITQLRICRPPRRPSLQPAARATTASPTTLAFGFRIGNGMAWPLTADKLVPTRIARMAAESSVHVFMDYETFGEHQWAETGHFRLPPGALPAALASRNIACVHPSTLATRRPVRDAVSFPTDHHHGPIVERDTSAWLGNRMQRAAFERLYRLRPETSRALGDSVAPRGMAPPHHERSLLLHVHQVVRGRRRAQVLQPAPVALRRVRGVHERPRPISSAAASEATRPWAVGGRRRDGGRRVGATATGGHPGCARGARPTSCPPLA